MTMPYLNIGNIGEGIVIESSFSFLRHKLCPSQKEHKEGDNSHEAEELMIYQSTYSFGFSAQLRTAVTHALTHGIPIILAPLHPLTHSTLATIVLGKGIPAVWFGYRTTPFEIYTYHIAPSPSLPFTFFFPPTPI